MPSTCTCALATRPLSPRYALQRTRFSAHDRNVPLFSFSPANVATFTPPMRQLRFTHVFAVLMVLAGLCAFALPARISDRVRTNVQVLFVPISWPTHKIGTWLVNRLAPDRVHDDGAKDQNHPRNVRELVEE